MGSKKYIKADEIRLVHSGNDYFDVLEKIIGEAKEIIHFHTYIFDGDETGIRIADALINAAERNVQVNVLLDGYGSRKLSKKIVKRLLDSGINFRFFNLYFFQNIHIGRRLHHKIIVADQNIALIGGINIANKYKGTKEELPWLDYAILLKGKICEVVNKICQEINQREFRKKKTSIITKHTEPETDFILAQFRVNDWLRGKNQIAASYFREIRKAKHSITIIASYFLPGLRLKKALIDAAGRGVEINIILSGISDVPVFRVATSYLYRVFLNHSINIYEWKKSILHGKVAVIDNEWTTIGSFNLNHLSAFGSIELNVDVLDKTFAKSCSKHFMDVIENGCEKIEVKTNNNHSFFYRLKRAVAFYFTRTIIKILALFPRIFSFYNKKFE
ncbi:MAG: hypothetical protein A3F72_13430 [Bacteroidetes bacterium RIFCSPLOWO2_12_FULL_35_15]|nr:MAG: hypothetical protein A3F72_13430 [Bacteroidetes bacterium RIFCSPLOWO2_12_FULL_35_15]